MALTLNKNLFKAVQESNESPHGIPGALNHPLLEFYSTSVPLSSVHTLFRNAVISNKQCLTGPPSPCPSGQVILSGHQSSSTSVSSHRIKKDAYFYLPLAYSCFTLDTGAWDPDQLDQKGFYRAGCQLKRMVNGVLLQSALNADRVASLPTWTWSPHWKVESESESWQPGRPKQEDCTIMRQYTLHMHLSPRRRGYYATTARPLVLFQYSRVGLHQDNSWHPPRLSGSSKVRMLLPNCTVLENQIKQD